MVDRRNLKSNQKWFAGFGFVLGQFVESDTRRIGPDGEEYGFYAAKDGELLDRFTSTADASCWIERWELSHPEAVPNG